MIRKNRGSIEWLEFELLADIPNLVQGVFLRLGGTSAPPFDSLNLGESTGDEKRAVEQNRSLLCEALQLKKLISARQTHGSDLLEVPAADLKRSCDGLITRRVNEGLLIQHADCQAAIFCDPIQRVIANVHCGWRGNVQNIYAKTVARLGGRPENLLVCISPSLGPMAAEFIHYREEFPSSFFSFQTRPTYFDFWAISRAQLEEAGVLSHHIEVASVCTYANPLDFFSYRRDKVTGRNGTVIAWKECTTL